jgi:hypothetical protein
VCVVRPFFWGADRYLRPLLCKTKEEDGEEGTSGGEERLLPRQLRLCQTQKQKAKSKKQKNKDNKAADSLIHHLGVCVDLVFPTTNKFTKRAHILAT